jgi:predicted transcriptional regulator
MSQPILRFARPQAQVYLRLSDAVYDADVHVRERGHLSGADLPPAVVEFIIECIDSVEQLEMLVLLRTQRDRGWTPAQLAAEMRTTEGSATKRLKGLLKAGLVVSSADREHRYAPKDSSKDAVVAAVAMSYLTRRFSVIDVILVGRRNQLGLFSDAFRLRRKGDKDG